MKYLPLLIVPVTLLAGCIPPPPSAAPSTPASTAPESPPQMERVVAEKGVGIKGRSLDEHEGVIVTPVKAIFSVQERMVFDVQLKQALSLYEATNGKKPQSHEEYMSKIVEANNIKLPELPAGHKYVYDPQREELMVERPAQ